MATADRVIRTGRGLWPLLRKIFSISFFSILLLLIIVYAIIMSIQQGSIEPLVTGVGGRAFIALESLNQDSLVVLSGDYVDMGKFDKFKHFISIIGSFFLIFLWLNLLSGIIARTIFSGDTSRWLSNWSIALAFFIFLQIIFTLIAGHYGYIESGFSPADSLRLPWDTIKNFGKAVPIMIRPIIDIMSIFERGSDIPKNITDLNQTINHTINP